MVKFQVQQIVLEDIDISSALGTVDATFSVNSDYVRKHLGLFIRSDYGEITSIECPEHKAQDLLQNMRVRISRLKAKAKKQGRKVREFKMILFAIIPLVDKPGFVYLQVKKTETLLTTVAEALAELEEDFGDAMYPIKGNK